MRWNPEGTAPPRKILFVQWRRIGDAVLVTPALDAAREAWPEAEIHLLVSPPAADLFAGDRRVSALWMRPPARRLPSLGRDLRREGFDLVFDFQSLVATAFLARCTGGYSVGYAKRGRRLLYHRRVAARAHRGSGYAADHKLDLLRAAGVRPRHVAPRLVPPARAASLWTELPHGPRVALVPVSLRAAKRWEPARFAEAAARLHARAGAVFALVGGPGEDEDLRTVASGMAGVPHVVRTFSRLGDTASVLAGADLFLGNDNGPRHVAIALGRPTVAWFGGRNPGAWTPPASDRHRVLWDPLRGDGSVVRADLCILPESPEAAADAAAELLAAVPRRAAP